MQVIYVGGAPDVDLPLPDGRVVTVARGEAVAVDAEHGARLLEQPTNWQPAPEPTAPTTKDGE